ncbi:MAG TPA: hypothetical protein PK760_16320, partial [Flavobacteriales bacterium]|nr:hypothetical protein [Flavobacteriales bacterium]
IALTHAHGRVFRTARPIAKGTRFKIEVTNNLECYTYLFGEETDGSTYVLFPYSEKHSPYCGVTGMRQFPKDQSLTADEVGDMDIMAILVTNQPFGYPEINERMNKFKAASLEVALPGVLGDELLNEAAVDYTDGETIGASGPASKNALAIMLEIEKR